MAFRSSLKNLPANNEPQLGSEYISRKDFGFVNFYKDYFLTDTYDPTIYIKDIEQSKKIVSQFEQECENFFKQNKEFHGRNKEGELCILGYELCHYNRGGAIFEPIIYNLETKSYTTNYKKLRLSRHAARDYQAENYDNENYKKLRSVLFVFADNKNYYQFIFHKEHPLNEENKEAMIHTLGSMIVETKPRFKP